jgi:hypothetical protein
LPCWQLLLSVTARCDVCNTQSGILEGASPSYRSACKCLHTSHLLGCPSPCFVGCENSERLDRQLIAAGGMVRSLTNSVTRTHAVSKNTDVHHACRSQVHVLHTLKNRYDMFLSYAHVLGCAGLSSCSMCTRCAGRVRTLLLALPSCSESKASFIITIIC